MTSTSTVLSFCRSTVYFYINCVNSWRIYLWHWICSKHIVERTEICLNHKLSCEEKGAQVQGTSSSGQCTIKRVRRTRLLNIENITTLFNIFGEFNKLLLKTYLINNLQAFMQIRVVINPIENPEPRQTFVLPCKYLTPNIFYIREIFLTHLRFLQVQWDSMRVIWCQQETQRTESCR